MTDMKLALRGLRGESFADVARRTGGFGADSNDTDAEVLAKVASTAAETAGVAGIYDSKAAATAALASITEGDVILVIADESNNGWRALYRKESGALVLKAVLDASPTHYVVKAFTGAAIQAQIDLAHAAGGGRVFLPVGTYPLGGTGLITYANVILEGEVGRYGGSTTRGVKLTYSGTGSAIYGERLLDPQVRNLMIDCTSATGTAVTGLWLNGCWKARIKDVTVVGVTPAKGYSMLLDINEDEGPWGAQHNYLEGCETPDGIVRIEGISGDNGVTTTVLNTHRGMMFQALHSQVTYINSTAESFVDGPGFEFSGLGCDCVLIGCDIEGTGGGYAGIKINDPAEVREIGTLWAGFSGTIRVDGRMATVRSYGGCFDYVDGDLTVGIPSQVLRAGNRDVSDIHPEYVVANSVTGGNQDGYPIWKRRKVGALVTSHDWENSAKQTKIAPVASTSATTVATIPVPSGAGLDISAAIYGTQIGDGVFGASRRCMASNNGGTVTVAQEASALSTGVNMQLSFVASGANVLIQVTPTTANASDVYMDVDIKGPWISFT